MATKNYACVTCYAKVDKLYKEYSSTVLKLVQCEKCQNIADKYIEYDPIIILIDLVLLDKKAFTHILFNTEFKTHWRLAAILLLMEAYSERSKLFYEQLTTENIFHQLNFYTFCLIAMIGQATFLLTIIGTSMLIGNKSIPLKLAWKCVTLAAFGRLFHLPALIWGDMRVTDTHYMFVLVYTLITHFVTHSIVFNSRPRQSVCVVSLAFIVRFTCTFYLHDLFQRVKIIF